MPKLTRNKLLKAKNVHIEKLNVGEEILDVKIKDELTDEEVVKFTQELIVYTKFVQDTKEIKGLSVDMLTIMLLIKNMTDLEYEIGDNMIDNLSDISNMTVAMKKMKCNDGESVFLKIVNSLNQNEINRLDQVVGNLHEIYKGALNEAV